MSDSQENKSSQDKEMPLLAHLVELRTRLVKAVVTILIIFLGLIYFANDLYLIVAKPLMAALPEGSEMVSTSVIAPFFTPFKLALVLSFFIAIPVVLHQIWAFVSPALYQNERRFAIPLLISSVFLFYGGMVFCYFVVFPLMFEFFPSVIPEGIRYIPDMSDSLNIMLKLFFAFGVAFEVPIATMLLIWSGTTTVQSLKEKRPYIVVGAFVVGMLLTPPDAISQTLLALPMWLLFELGLLFSTWFNPSTARSTPTNEA
ncbi:MAG: twin-arginine translocase subunit TatC [Gammaproteobacteria bacterium]|nr:twin-arginine translocase subunit TatC [Gammaproteobacteria bacterium]